MGICVYTVFLCVASRKNHAWKLILLKIYHKIVKWQKCWMADSLSIYFTFTFNWNEQENRGTTIIKQQKQILKLFFKFILNQKEPLFVRILHACQCRIGPERAETIGSGHQALRSITKMESKNNFVAYFELLFKLRQKYESKIPFYKKYTYLFLFISKLPRGRA